MSPTIRFFGLSLVLAAASLSMSHFSFAEEPTPAASPSPSPTLEPVPQAAVAAEPAAEKTPSLFLGFHGGLTSGQMNSASAPKGVSSSMMASTGYFVGVNFEFALIPNFHLFIDGTTASQQVDVAGSDGITSSFWIYEQTGYSTHDRTLATDCIAQMRGTGFRGGMKYYLTENSAIRPWAGLGYGLYRWTFSYLNSEKTKTYGEATGMVSGLTYVVGVSFVLDPKTHIVLFGDLTSPAAFPKIDNLFGTGWTWDNTGGNPIMGPYRVGIAFQQGM